MQNWQHFQLPAINDWFFGHLAISAEKIYYNQIKWRTLWSELYDLLLYFSPSKLPISNFPLLSSTLAIRRICYISTPWNFHIQVIYLLLLQKNSIFQKDKWNSLSFNAMQSWITKLAYNYLEKNGFTKTQKKGYHQI